MADKYEPKREFRWILRIDGIESYLIRSVTRPSYRHNVTAVAFGPPIVTGPPIYDPLEIELYDVRDPNKVRDIEAWMHGQNPVRDVEIVTLDETGTAIEKWRYLKCFLTKVDYGRLNYSSNEACSIKLELMYDRFIYEDPSDWGDWEVQVRNV